MEKLVPISVKLEGGKKYQRLLSGAGQTVSLRSGYVNLAPGADVGEHITEAKEEAIVILSGAAKISFQEYPEIVVYGGSLVYIPPQVKHNVTNIGKESLNYVYITAIVKE